MMDINTLDEIVCTKTRKKAERVISEFINTLCIYNDGEITGNIGVVAHVSKGTLMKAELNVHQGIKLK